jgi:hypothetical protein
MIIPNDNKTINGRRLPKDDLHVSDNEPIIGERKNPMHGLRHQIVVVLFIGTPNVRRVGVTNAVSAE